MIGALGKLLREGRSFSGRERNCCFLNTGRSAPGFADISGVTGLDLPEDGRALATVDWDYDGDLDLWLTNRNGPRLRLLRNEHESEHHFLALRLQGNGQTTNRDAVGARVEVLVRGPWSVVRGPIGENEPTSDHRPQTTDHRPPLIQTLHAGDGFVTQSSKWLHFGLGDAAEVERVVVRWPGGAAETFDDLEADHFYLLAQGAEGPQRFTPPQNASPLPISAPQLPAQSKSLRIGLAGRTPSPEFSFLDQHDRHIAIPAPSEKPLLLNLWADWCGPCRAELAEISQRRDEIRQVGLEVLVLNVDGVGDIDSADLARSRKFLESIDFPFAAARTTHDTLQKISLLQRRLVDPARIDTLPTSLLIAPGGSVEAIYKGQLDVDRLLADARRVRSAAPQPTDLAIPFPGRWHDRPARPQRDRLITLGSDFLLQGGYPRDAEKYYCEAARLDPDSQLAERNLARVRALLRQLKDEEAKFAEQVRQTGSAAAHHNLAVTLGRQHRVAEAIDQFEQALHVDPNLVTAHLNLGALLAREGNLEKAAFHLQAALRLDAGNKMAQEVLQDISTARQKGQHPSDVVSPKIN